MPPRPPSANGKRSSPRRRQTPPSPSRLLPRLPPRWRQTRAPPRSRRAIPMAEYSAKDIAALRKATGAPMLDCKSALEESDGDRERALDILRAKGLAKAGKLSDREATEGAVDVL